MLDKPSHQTSPTPLQLALHVFALFGFALSQPLFSVLSNYPEFFVARDASPADILLFSLALSVIIPGLISVTVAAIHYSSARIGQLIGPAVIALLSGTIALQILKAFTLIPGLVLFCGSLVLGGLAAVAYRKVKVIHAYLSVLSPLALVFPILFIFNSDVSRVIFPEPSEAPIVSPEPTADSEERAQTNDNPVIMLILDEFPLATLLDAERQIDAARFPNLAELAGQANWYRNATTVSDSTLISIPTILSGQTPTLDNARLPTLQDYPNNLFTLLSATHELKIIENGTRLSPRLDEEEVVPLSGRQQSLMSDLMIVYGHIVLPSDLTQSLPPIDQSWNTFRRREFAGTRYTEFEDFSHDFEGPDDLFTDLLTGIQAGEAPTLHFLHAMLPHKPWQFMPDGARYLMPPDVMPGGQRIETRFGTYPAWGDDSSLVEYAYRRHALQAGFVDQLIGELIAKLKAVDLFEKSLIVVTSDHGTSFRPNAFQRRVSDTNQADIMWIPLLMKLPFQSQGMVTDRNAESIDILPTMAEALNLEVDWPLDGHSLLDTSLPERPVKTIFAGASRSFQLPADSDAFSASVEHKLKTIRSGPWENAYGIAEFAHLVGAPLEDFETTDIDAEVQIIGENLFNNINLSGSFVLTDIKGQVVNAEGFDTGEYFVIGVNGRVGSVIRLGPEFRREGKFATLIPRSALRQGFNEISAYLMHTEGGGIALQRLRGGTSLPYSLRVSDGTAPDFLQSPTGEAIPVDGQAVRGYVRSDMQNDGRFVSISGWAFDSANTERADVLIFSDGVLLASVTPSVIREDVVASISEAAGLETGFRVLIPAANFPDLADARIRVFGVSGQSATELIVVDQWVFHRRGN